MFNDVRQMVAKFASDNSAALLTAGGVVGAVATAVLAGRGGYRFAELLTAEKEELLHQELDKIHPDDELRALPPQVPFQTRAKLITLCFGPSVIVCSTTIAAIIMSNRVSAQKAAALAAAYGLAERNLSEYKEKVAEKLTGPKQTAVTDELAQEAVNKTPGSDKIVFVEGEVLCFDKPTGRYFNSTMESIKQAVNTTNAEIFNHGFTTVNFFYTELGLDPTTWSGEVGFDTGNLLELSYSTIMAPGNRPCIAIDFSHMPRPDFDTPKYS